MCSSSKGRGDGCGNLVELINGPIGNLVGIGVKVLIDRASASTPNPVGWNENVAANVPKEQNKDIEKLYDNIEAHLKGTLRVLKPAMEIKNILYGECRSAGHEKPGGNSSSRLVYYTPQNRKKCRASCCCCRRDSCCEAEKVKKEKQRQGECDRCSRSQVSLSTPSHSFNAQSTPRKIPSQPNDSRGKTFQINISRIDPPSSTMRKKLCEVYETEKEAKHADNSRKSRSESRHNKTPRCLICNVTLRDNSLLAILPCNHSFCYPCLRKSKRPKCQKCNETFDMKDVTQFSTFL